LVDGTDHYDKKIMPYQIEGRDIKIKGIVQGVGFRPFVYGLAVKNNIVGTVKNSSAGVEIIANGTQSNLEKFTQQLKLHPPKLAKIDQFDWQPINPDGFSEFNIIESEAIPGEFIPISPDVSICEDCQKELFNQNDRRFRYPFINCTNCGPRFTIIKNIPYDRPSTTMRPFEMCDQCNEEYSNPIDRRFHAQPIACPTCGPHVWFSDGVDESIIGENAIQKARQLIKNGKILAIKGLGGFHLACNARNEDALRVLRERKHRSSKPFAVMAFDLNAIKEYCHVSLEEAEILASVQHPIVIVDKKDRVAIPDAIAPGMNSLGVMLPYTPLHLLMLEPAPDYPQLLVMTSGNISEEPISYQNEDGVNTLGNIADSNQPKSR